MRVTAQLNNLRQSPRKVRLVAALIRGMEAERAEETLRFITKRAARPLRKLIESARANARDKQLSQPLYIRTLTVDEGFTLRRVRPAAQGQAKPIRKRTSRVYIELAEGKNAKPEEKTDNEKVTA